MVHGLAREIKVPTPTAGRAAAPFQILVAKGQGERAVIAVLKPQQASVSRAPAAGLGGIAVEPYHDRRYLEPDGGKMRKPRGVVITPFDETGQRVGSAVRHGLQALGVEIFYFDELRPGASWANAVSDAIGSADFIVADISRPNANVLYELGHAHALRKPSILLRSRDADSRPPEALVGYHYIAYDPSDLSALEQDVQRAAQRYVERVASAP